METYTRKCIYTFPSLWDWAYICWHISSGDIASDIIKVPETESLGESLGTVLTDSFLTDHNSATRFAPKVYTGIIQNRKKF